MYVCMYVCVVCLQLVVTLLDVSEKEEGVVALHLHIGPFFFFKPALGWSRYRDANPVPIKH